MGSGSKGRVRVCTFGFLLGSGNYTRVLKNMENLTPSFIFIAFLCTNVMKNTKRYEYFLENKFLNEKYYFSEYNFLIKFKCNF